MINFCKIFFIAGIFCQLAGITAAYAQNNDRAKHFAVTNYSANYMREKPDFPQELGNQVLMGTPVEIVGEEGYWKQIISPEPYKAWCVNLGLTEMTESEVKEYISAPKYIVTSDFSHVYSAKDLSSERISDLVSGDLLRQTSSKKSKKGFTEVMLPSGKTGYVPSDDIADFSLWAESRKATFENISQTALSFLGIPYLWGGTSVKGMDCSGLTRMVWFMNGVLLPRNASQQAKTGTFVEILQECEPPMNEDGTRMHAGEITRAMMQRRISKLQPGDLIFFGKALKFSHVGIYLGNGRFIHSSHCVRINSLLPGEEDYYDGSPLMHTARRIIGQEDKGTGIVSISKSPSYFPQTSEN